MATRWEVLMERVPREQRVLFALPVASSPDRDYACPAVEALRRQVPQGGAAALIDGSQLMEAARVLEEVAAVGEIRGDYTLALQAVGELMATMTQHKQQAQAWKARLLAARLLTTTYRTREAAALLRKLREELREGCFSTGLEGLVRLVEAEGEARCWRVGRAMELLHGVGEEQLSDRGRRGRGGGGVAAAGGGVMALAWMRRAEATCLRVLGCVVGVEENKGAARRAAEGAVAAARRAVGGRAGAGLVARAEMALALAERAEGGVESGCEALLRATTGPSGDAASPEGCARRYLQLCWRMAELGRPAEAMKAVGRVARGMLAQFGPNSTHALELQFLAASGYRQQGLHEHAEALMRAAWETAQRVFPWPHPCHSSILLGIAELSLLSLNPGRAVTLARQARAASRMLPAGPSPRWLLCYQLTRAACHLLMGHQSAVSVAMKRYSKVLTAVLGSPGRGGCMSPAVASLAAAAYRGMAKCLHAKGQLTDAVIQLELALEVKGLPTHMQPPALRSLAALLWAAGRRERAVEMQQRAVMLYRTTHSHGPEQAMVDVRNLAQMHAQLGRYAKAAEWLEEASLPQLVDSLSLFALSDLRLHYLFLVDRSAAMTQFRALTARVLQELGRDHPMATGFQNKLLSLDLLVAPTSQQNSASSSTSARTPQTGIRSSALSSSPPLNITRQATTMATPKSPVNTEPSSLVFRPISLPPSAPRPPASTFTIGQTPSPLHSNGNISTASTSTRGTPTPLPSGSSPLLSSLREDQLQFDSLLEEVGLSEHKGQLLRDGANLQTIGFVTAEDLLEYGIPKFTARKIVASISESLESSKRRRLG